MKVNAKAIIEKYERPTDRKRMSMYFSEKIYNDFKSNCDVHGMSSNEVLEHLMQQFNEEVHAQKTPSRKRKKN